MHTLSDWQQRAAQQSFIDTALIDGRRVAACSGATFEAINPATNQLLAKVAACGELEVDQAVRSARRAFEQGPWARMAPTARKRILLRLAELMLAHREELALLDSLNMGKPVMDAYTIDVPGAAHVFAWYGEALDKLYDQVAPTAGNALATVTREALGVVGAVVPWNFPLDMAAWKVAPALAAGNSVVLKPAEQSPFSALRLAELALEAGLPEGVLNVVTGLGEQAGKALGLHPDVDCLVFTGSTQVGKYFMQYSAQSNLKQVWLECGGKSPNLVFEDCRDRTWRRKGSLRHLLQPRRSLFGQLAPLRAALDPRRVRRTLAGQSPRLDAGRPLGSGQPRRGHRRCRAKRTHQCSHRPPRPTAHVYCAVASA